MAANMVEEALREWVADIFLRTVLLRLAHPRQTHRRQPNIRLSPTSRGTPKLRTYTLPGTNGLDTIAARMLRVITWIILLNTGISPADLAKATCGTWPAAVPAGSGSMASTSAFPRWTSASAQTGCGTAIRS